MKFEFDNSDLDGLKPVIAAVVQETIENLSASGLLASSGTIRKIAFSEAEAARLIGLNQHQLRDERRAGRIQASQIRGRRIRYTEDDLRRYLAERQYEPP